MAKIGPTQLVRMGNNSSRGAQPSSEALTANGRDCILLQVKCDAIETLVFGFKVIKERRRCGQVKEGAIASGYALT